MSISEPSTARCIASASSRRQGRSSHEPTTIQRLVRAGILVVASAALLLALSGVEGHAQGRGGGEWTTSGFDAQRSGWLRADARLTKEAVQKGEFAVPLEDEVRECQPPAELVDAAGAARSPDRLPRLQEPRLLRRQRRPRVRRSTPISRARTGRRSSITRRATGGQPPSSLDCPGRSDRDAEPAHGARAGPAGWWRRRRWPRRRSQRQRRGRAGKRRGGPEPGAATTAPVAPAAAVASRPRRKPGAAAVRRRLASAASIRCSPSAATATSTRSMSATAPTWSRRCRSFRPTRNLRR